MQAGIVGLPNVGKSTLFMALTKTRVKADIYFFSTTDVNVGVVEVPDKRLDFLFDVYRPKKKTPTVVELVDLVGLVKEASKGEGLGNRFLAKIREVDSLIHLVRCFQDENIAHVDGQIDPIRDVETIETELMLADLQSLEKRIERVQRKAKGGEKRCLEELTILRRIEENLNRMVPVREIDFTPEEMELVRDYFLLTSKPVLYVANIDEDSLPDGGNEFSRKLEEYLAREGAKAITICAKVESELAELEAEEAREFAQALGTTEPGLEKVIGESYRILNLITFFTVNENEARGTAIVRGSTASEAAGKIHSDMEGGFVKAEVVSFDDFKRAGGWGQAKEQGLLRYEGRNYLVQDGDIMFFKFSA